MFKEMDELIEKFYQDADEFINKYIGKSMIGKIKGETKDEEN